MPKQKLCAFYASFELFFEEIRQKLFKIIVAVDRFAAKVFLEPPNLFLLVTVVFLGFGDLVRFVLVLHRVLDFRVFLPQFI